MLTDTFSKHFQELQDKLDAGETRSLGTYLGWATSAQSLIKAVFGEHSPHYTNFTEVLNKSQTTTGTIGIFKSAKEDFEGGYVFNVDLRISGEVFGDFIVLAKHSLAEGHKDVAAVLACAALEDALKRYAVAEGLNVDDKSMTEVINALKSKGLVSGSQKSLLGAMPKLRNDALHAEWEKISEPEVNSVIAFVEQFLLTKCTPV